MAVVFISRMVDGKPKQEGICLKCAQELGIKPINDIIEKMGLSPEDIENMNDELENFVDENGELKGLENLPQIFGNENPDSDTGDDSLQSNAPSIDLSKLMNSSGSGTPEKAPGENEKKQGRGPKQRAGQQQKVEKKYLSKYCECLTDKAREGKLDRIVGREKDIDRVIQILCRRQKNNPCLIGEPGVGKTAIAEALSQRIADGEVPYKLKNDEIYLVDLTALVAGTQFRGQFEARVLGLLNEIGRASCRERV